MSQHQQPEGATADEEIRSSKRRAQMFELAEQHFRMFSPVGWESLTTRAREEYVQATEVTFGHLLDAAIEMERLKAPQMADSLDAIAGVVGAAQADLDEVIAMLRTMANQQRTPPTVGEHLNEMISLGTPENRQRLDGKGYTFVDGYTFVEKDPRADDAG